MGLGMFGIKFPDKISITEEDELYAQKKVPDFLALWDKDKEMRTGVFKIYKYKLPKILKCYIVTTKTSAINLERKYIYLSMSASAEKIPMIIIHEFSHIALLAKWGSFCKKLGYTDNGIQELKEVLTAINNIEFEDINDKGYSIHEKIRKIVKEMWLKKYSLEEIISDSKIINLVNSLDTIQKKKK
ncbi:MAG: hypothetical protein ABH956_02955 [Candidatus Nealsonbacteria bacterium]